jgi:superfamily II DNA helicase RecQ
VAFEFFKVPVHAPGAFADELNAFIAGHKVASVRKKFVDCGENSFWAICVDYQLNGDAAATGSNAAISRNRIDYKTILPADEFVVFSQLRELRKELALAESVPVYVLFSNEQLAQMVQRRCRSKSDLAQIEGVGETKIEKYAERMLPLLLRLEAKPDAASDKPV